MGATVVVIVIVILNGHILLCLLMKNEQEMTILLFHVDIDVDDVVGICCGIAMGD